MNRDDIHDRLEHKVGLQAKRLKKAEQERHHWLAQTLFIGSLGVMFVLPVIVGAYLGSWLDQQLEEFSTSWTLSLIIVGVFIGAVNVYLQIRE
ncbi:MAG: AtpZ/AtpI family protein [Halieaceae bacterium]|nr:AtpZ/AtpI family protein [Halieaceae bacterium]